MAPFESLDTVS